MTIGVKFCGGCNPTYDRLKALEAIKERLRGHVFQSYQDHVSYDAILIICGCHAACAKGAKDGRNVWVADKKDIRTAGDIIAKMFKKRR